MTHPNVRHPADLLAEAARDRAAVLRWNDAALSWLAEHVLASMAMFDVALILPLLVLPLSDSVKLALGVVSGSWIQWWALPALQRQAIKGDAARSAKADVDHVALSHIATTVDRVLERLDAMTPAGAGAPPPSRPTLGGLS